MPPPIRENLQRLVSSWLGQVAEGMAERGKFDADAARSLIHRGPFLASQAQADKLIDKIGYWNDLTKAVNDRAGKDASWFSLDRLCRQSRRTRRRCRRASPWSTALGAVQLSTGKGDGLFGPAAMDSSEVANRHPRCRRRSERQGDHLPRRQPRRLLCRLRHDLERSAACPRPRQAGDRLHGRRRRLRRLFRRGAGNEDRRPAGDHHGLDRRRRRQSRLRRPLEQAAASHWDGVKAGANADFESPHRLFSNAGWARMEEGLDRVYADFTQKVAAGPQPADRESPGRWPRARSGPAATRRTAAWSTSSAATASPSAWRGTRPRFAADRQVRIEEFPPPDNPLEKLFEQAMASGQMRHVEAQRLETLLRLADWLEPVAAVIAPVRRLGRHGAAACLAGAIDRQLSAAIRRRCGRRSGTPCCPRRR